MRSTRKLSIDAYENVKLMKSICSNLKYSEKLQEVTLCGFRMTEACATKLNAGILSSNSVRKVRLSFCIYKREVLQILMPALTQCFSIQEVNLSANDLDDSYSYMINKIMSAHQEYKDEQIWQYGLRDEIPPKTRMSSLKKLNLSHN